MRQTRFPSSAKAAPRLTVVVVFPTPPFWFISAMIRMAAASLRARLRPCQWNYPALSLDYKLNGLLRCAFPSSHIVQRIEIIALEPQTIGRKANERAQPPRRDRDQKL